MTTDSENILDSRLFGILSELDRLSVEYSLSRHRPDRLTSITRNGVTWASYGYNALEQLVSRSSSAPSGTVHYLYDLDGHLIAEADGATGAVLRDYIWLAACTIATPRSLTRVTASSLNSREYFFLSI